MGGPGPANLQGLTPPTDAPLEDQWRYYEEFDIGAWKKCLSLLEDSAFADELGKRFLDQFCALEACYPDFRQTMDSTYAASTIQLWSALEFLAAELWSAAVDSRPRSLGIAAAEWVINTNVYMRGHDRQELEKTIFGRGHLRIGAFLRRRGIVEFSSASRIRRCCESVFSELKLPDGWDRLAAKLQGARNLLLHNGGVVNEQFLRLTRLPLTPGQSLKLWAVFDIYARGALWLGSALLISVDHWLASHADTPVSPYIQ